LRVNIILILYEVGSDLIKGILGKVKDLLLGILGKVRWVLKKILPI